MAKVLRSVVQKNGASQYDFSSIPYNFGTQGIYTQMFSGLNLEQQLLIGGASDISYQGQDEYFKVVEKYFLHNSNEFCYELETVVSREIPNFLIDELPLRQDDFLVNDEVENTNPYLFLVTEGQTPQNSIIITLYAVFDVDTQYEYKEKLKMKYIIFTRDTEGKRYISEILVDSVQNDNNSGGNYA